MDEKIGGNPRPLSSFRDFNNFFDCCGLEEPPFTGSCYTWRGVRGRHVIRCKLDRSIANLSWFDGFPETQVKVLDSYGSDHKVLVTMLQGGGYRRKRGFRFDNRWLKREGLDNVIKSTWQNGRFGGSFSRLRRGLKGCVRGIEAWNQTFTRNSARAMREISLKITWAENQPEHNEEIPVLKRKLREEILREEEYWHGTSRITWMKSGERNTKFFHAKTKQRRKQNRILFLKDSTGTIQYSARRLDKVCTDYFSDIFTSRGTDHQQGERVKGIRNLVSTEMNVELTRPVSVEELKSALFSMDPNKTAGPDGLTAGFFQKFWKILVKDVLSAVQNFLNSKEPINWMNQTMISLVPKVQNPSKMTEFRPISLCNVIYKILAKVLANRLKVVLPNLISENQSGFVAGRSITDNILVAHEALHLMKNERKVKNGHMAVKLDMSKAYDRMEWGFLRRVLESFGFHIIWIEWIMACVTSVSYQILINGGVAGEVVPHRGLRQGDPLSSYLFVLCAESLSGRLKEAGDNESFKAMTFGRGGPSISHLLFADDALILGRATAANATTFKRILKEYEEDSGQQVNFDKCGVSFSKGTAENLRAEILHILDMAPVTQSGLYLGLPEAFGRSKISLFSYICDRVHGRTHSWYGKLLSPAGKEVLLKSVASAMPSYAMSAFLLPKSLIGRITKEMASYWWNTEPGVQRIRWLSWEKMKEPRCRGGLGFKDLEDFNIAMLGKQAWRIHKNPDCLLARILRSKYFKNGDFSSARVGHNASWGWRSIMKGKELVFSGLRWVIKSGQQVNAWNDNWIPSDPPTAAPLPPDHLVDPDLKVSDLIDEELGTWNLPKLQTLFSADTIISIRKIPISRIGGIDQLKWNYDISGIYTVKSGYKFLRGAVHRPAAPVVPQSTQRVYKQIWRMKLPGKVKTFLWRCARNILPTASNIQRRVASSSGRCPVCGENGETAAHVLFQCPAAQQVWLLAPTPSLLPQDRDFSFLEWLQLNWNTGSLMDRERRKSLLSWLCWKLWLARNAFLFSGHRWHPVETINKAIKANEEWFHVVVDGATDQERGRGRGDGSSRWTLPDKGVICCVDGSWSTEQENMGLGWAVWDVRGAPKRFIACNGGIGGEALLAEAAALRQAMGDLIDRGITDVIFLTDCRTLSDVLNDGSNHLAIEAILDDICLLKDLFLSCYISFLPRDGNKIADALAKHGRSLRSTFLSCDVCPSWADSSCIPFKCNEILRGSETVQQFEVVVSGNLAADE